MKNQHYTQLFGGLLARSTSDDIVPSLDSVQQPKPRKVKRKKSSSEDDTRGIGKRGRPRVDPKDQSAVERRRTQIRLAQRAYRERKETTISALEQRVSDLTHTVDEMNQIFLDYNTKAISSGIAGLNPGLGLGLKETTNRFLQLARNANLDPGHDDAEESPEETSRDSTQDGSSAGRRQAIFVSSVSQLDLTHQYSPPEKIAMLGYEMSYEGVPTPDTTRTTNDAQQLTANQSYSTDRTWEDSNWQQLTLQSYDMEAVSQYSMPTTGPIPKMLPGIPNSPKPFYTYSFQEGTFARRLLRSSYENAYRIINDPNTSPDAIYHRLRLSFCFTNLHTINPGIRDILSRTRHQSLENWDGPILHNGGAGLHFPRGGLDSEAEPAPVGWKEKRLSMAPRRLGVAHSREADRLEVDEFAKFAGCEGTWFDSNDVEQYLRTKGLYLDGQSSLAEIEVDVPSPLTLLAPGTAAGSPRSSSTESFNSPASSGDRALDSNLFSASDSDGYFFDMDTSISSAWPAPDLPELNTGNESMDFTLGWSHNINSNPKSQANLTYHPSQNASNMNMPLFPNYHPPLPSRKRKVTIDVDKLVELLNEHSVCLVRAPGYRKEDVDVALRQAVREAEAL